MMKSSPINITKVHPLLEISGVCCGDWLIIFRMLAIRHTPCGRYHSKHQLNIYLSPSINNMMRCYPSSQLKADLRSQSFHFCTAGLPWYWKKVIADNPNVLIGFWDSLSQFESATLLCLFCFVSLDLQLHIRSCYTLCLFLINGHGRSFVPGCETGYLFPQCFLEN